jgi:hypothetical protein
MRSLVLAHMLDSEAFVEMGKASKCSLDNVSGVCVLSVFCGWAYDMEPPASERISRAVVNFAKKKMRSGRSPY